MLARFQNSGSQPRILDLSERMPQSWDVPALPSRFPPMLWCTRAAPNSGSRPNSLASVF
jgi:hypothetical protein